MSSNMKVGARLRSQVDATEVLVVRPGAGTLECGGLAMVTLDAATDPVEATLAGDGAQVGKRYASVEAGVEVLVTKGGRHPLGVAGQVLAPKASKQLPSSD